MKTLFVAGGNVECTVFTPVQPLRKTVCPVLKKLKHRTSI